MDMSQKVDVAAGATLYNRSHSFATAIHSSISYGLYMLTLTCGDNTCLKHPWFILVWIFCLCLGTIYKMSNLMLSLSNTIVFQSVCCSLCKTTGAKCCYKIFYVIYWHLFHFCINSIFTLQKSVFFSKVPNDAPQVLDLTIKCFFRNFLSHMSASMGCLADILL